VAYDEGLAERVRDVIGARPGVTERKMFGGLGFMVGGNMACAVMSTGGLIVRLPPDEVEAACAEPHVGTFGREGAKPMTGFVLVEVEGVAEDADLARWVDAGAERAASLPPK
jgi:TfoX/Sxy family transcriptional regulator of competence genes